VALALFGVGALAGGRLVKRYGNHRGRLLSSATAIQGGFVAVSVILAALSGSPVATGYRYALIAVLAFAMGLQNASIRKIAVPDLTTTVLTMTITGIAADSRIAGGKGSKSGRRLLAVVAMLLGALVGAACVLHLHIVYALVIALILLAIVGSTTPLLGRSDTSWARS
jgi:uncharacterized membrane protein YoaK (UPF0700 family)